MVSGCILMSTTQTDLWENIEMITETKILYIYLDNFTHWCKINMYAFVKIVFRLR